MTPMPFLFTPPGNPFMLGGHLTVRMGHFYTILGYETVTAPKNFFYSHAAPTGTSYRLVYG